MRTAEYTRALYHSCYWSELVEQGWTTMHVSSDGVAMMIRERR